MLLDDHIGELSNDGWCMGPVVGYLGVPQEGV